MTVYMSSQAHAAGAQRMGKATWLCGVSVLAAAGLIALSATPAAAADAAPAKANDATTVGDVIVTARRVEERLQDVPVAVTALGQSKIDDLVVHTQADLVKMAPGLQITGCNSGAPPGASSCPLTIRGFSQILGASSSAVITYFDDAPNFPAATFDLQNIQVLKGPQGTLFGDTTTGGAVLYVPKKPNGSTGGFIEAEYGNYNDQRLTGAYENSLADDRIMFRFAGEFRHRDGLTTAKFTWRGDKKVDDVNNLQLRASLVLKPIESVENYSVFVFNQSRQTGSAQYPWFTDPRYFSVARVNEVPSANPTLAAQYEFYTGAPPPAGLTWSQIALAAVARQAAAGFGTVYQSLDQGLKSRNWGLVNQTKWEITPHVQIRNIFAMQWPVLNDINYPNAARGSGANFDGTDAPLLDRIGERNASARNAYDDNYYSPRDPWRFRQYTDEVQAVGDLFDNRIKWQAGFYYRRQRPTEFVNQQQTQLISFAGPSVAPTTAAACAALGAPAQPCYRMIRQSSQTHAFYTQEVFKLTDTINFTAGVRRTYLSQLKTENALAPYQFVDFTASNGVTIHQPIVIGGIKPYAGVPIITSYSPGAKSTTYSLTLDWKPWDNTLLYIAHRKGFKAGGLNSTAPVGSPFALYSPETVKDVEIGVKGNWNVGGMGVATSVSIYRDWYSDIQTQSAVPGVAVLLTVNGGQADFHGVEFDTTFKPASWFELTVQGAYAYARFTQNIENTTCATQFYRQSVPGQCQGIPTSTPIVIDHAAGTVSIQPVGLPARNFNYRPDRFGISPITWAIQPKFLLEPLTGKNITLGANIYHRDPESGIGNIASQTAGIPGLLLNTVYGPTDDLGTASIARYTLVDLSADWRHVNDMPISLWARVTNLTDKRYRYSAQNFQSTGLAGPTVSEPRMITVGVRYDF